MTTLLSCEHEYKNIYIFYENKISTIWKRLLSSLCRLTLSSRVCLSVCVCVCMCMHIYIYIHTHTYMRMYTYKHIHLPYTNIHAQNTCNLDTTLRLSWRTSDDETWSRPSTTIIISSENSWRSVCMYMCIRTTCVLLMTHDLDYSS